MGNLLTPDKAIDFSVLVEELSECFWVYDISETKFIYISPSVYQLRGLTVAEAMAESLEDSLTVDSLQKIKNGFLRRFRRFIEGDRSDSVVYNLSDYQQYCKDGSIKNIEISIRLKVDDQTKHILGIGVSRGINRRKLHEKKLIDTIRNQQQIIKAQKSMKTGKPELHVYFFGKFRALTDNAQKPVKWRTSKTEELFAFILQKERQYISKAEILGALWPELELDKANKLLHTTIYNLKKDLKSVDILFHLEQVNGFYCYEEHCFYSDLDELLNMIKTAVNPYDSLTEETVKKIERAISLYEGDYLAENDYPWATSQSAFYRHQFEKHTFDLARHYFFKRDYPSTKRVLSKLIEVDNLNERYHELLLNVFLFDDDYLSFTQHYEKLINLLQTELGQPPNPSIQTLHQQFRDYTEVSTIMNAHF